MSDDPLNSARTVRPNAQPPGDEPRSVSSVETLKPSNELGRIDRYELLEELGGGGFGCVYRARDTVAGVDVAVKGLPPLVQANKEELERVLENFALVSRLHHPNIAAPLVLHEVQSARYADERDRQKLRVLKGDYLFVMSFAPGVTLSKWRRQFPDGKVPVDQALDICGQIASALDYAHREKIIHRDVKPSNVVVETRGDEGRGVRERVVAGQTPESLPELTRRQNAVLLRALAKDPEQRFGSRGEVVEAFGGERVGRGKPRNTRKSPAYAVAASAGKARPAIERDLRGPPPPFCLARYRISASQRNRPCARKTKEQA